MEYKKKNNIILNLTNLHVFNFKEIIFILKIILLYLFIQTSEEKFKNIIYFSSEIHLVIKGPGIQKIIGKNFNQIPSEIKVNGITKEVYNNSCIMDYEENNVTFYFNEPVASCKNMFNEVINLKEIDLSNFDFFNVTSMFNMFLNCTSLEKVNFGNSQILDTSKVTDIGYMFSNCKKIKEINLKNLDTSSVNTMRDVFHHCEKLESVDISNFDTSLVTTMYEMFFHCYALKSIKFPETFNTSNVEIMHAMFSNCLSLTSLNLSTFNVSKAKNIGYMFHRCNKLKYLDISHFSTLNLIKIDYMFRYLSSLIYLNIYSLEINESVSKLRAFEFINSNVIICANKINMQTFLSSLNLTNNCSDICFEKNIKLDIVGNECIFSCKDKGYFFEKDNFCYSQCPDGSYPIFENNSYNDVYICSEENPKGYYFDDNDGFYKKCFESCETCYGPGNEKDNNCIKCKTNFKFLNDSIYINNCYENCQHYYYFNETNNYICTKNCSDTYDKLIIEKKKCIDKCQNDTFYKFEYNKICYKECPTGTIYIEEKDMCLDEKDIETTLSIKESTINYYTSIINDDISSIISTSINKEISYTNGELKFSTYLDKISVITDNYFSEVLNKTIISTYPDNSIIYNLNTDNTIYSNKISFNSVNSISNYILEESILPTKNYIININESDTNNILSSNIIVNTINQEDLQNQSNEEIYQIISQSEYKYKTNYIIEGNNDEIYQELIDFIKDYDFSNGEELVFPGEDNFIFHLTNSQNELEQLQGKRNNTNRYSIIDLGECENLLKEHYHINKNLSLLIFKLEKIGNKTSERSLQYEVYEPEHKTKLNLSICDKVNIEIYIPVILSDNIQHLYDELSDLGYDLFDINSPFYQDICTPYKSSNGTDVPLTDRKNYYYNNEETTCQPNCKFSDYLKDSQYLKCDCDISNSEINPKNIEQFNAKSIYKSFFNVLKYSNYKVLKCSKLAFSIKSFTINIGSILTLIYFIIYSIFLVIYILKGINQLKTDISSVIIEKTDNKDMNKQIILKEKLAMKKIEDNKQIENIKYFNNLKYQQKSKMKNKKDEMFILRNTKRKKKKSPKFLFTNPPKKAILNVNGFEIDSKNQIDISNQMYNNNILITNKSNSTNAMNKKKDIKKTEINKQIFDIIRINTKEKEQLDIYELNNLEYNPAKKLDKRNIFEIYWSLLKREHLIIFTFITKDDHNIMFIKYARFIFLLCSDMAMNVFFFSDETMHKMFLDYGKYNFIQQIPQIIYSTIITQLIEIFLCYLSMTDKHYYQIKECKKISRNSMIGIMKCIQIKIGFFFLFTSMMFFFYWYLITCFCSVYQNTQVAFIKDSLLSFLLGNLIPFGIYFIPSLFRIIALKTNKYKLEWVYNISNIVPFF